MWVTGIVIGVATVIGVFGWLCKDLDQMNIGMDGDEQPW